MPANGLQLNSSENVLSTIQWINDFKLKISANQMIKLKRKIKLILCWENKQVLDVIVNCKLAEIY